MPAVIRGTWTASSDPGANIVATATQAAAGAGLRNVCTSIVVTLTAGTTAPAAINVQVVLRDGASGTGTIVWRARLALPGTIAESAQQIYLDGLWIEGSENTAMTLEFGAAAGANTFETVAMTGQTAQ